MGLPRYVIIPILYTMDDVAIAWLITDTRTGRFRIYQRPFYNPKLVPMVI